MKDRKINICVLGSTYPRFDEDPQVPWLRKTVSLLKEKGHTVTVAASSFEGLGKHEIDGVEVLRFRYAPARWENLTHDEGAPSKSHTIGGKIAAAFYIISGILHMLYWSRTRKFDLIQVHWPFPHGLFAILPRLFFGTKVVMTAHGAGMAMARKSGLIRQLLKLALRHADSITANSSHTKNEIARLTGFSSENIPYGATVEFKSGQKPLSKKKTKILFSGRHIQRKGVDYLISALPQILEKHDVELNITGDGDRTDEWKRLSNELCLLNKVNFLGFVSNEELSELYQECDIYCLPAIYDDKNDTEGLGVVLIEALLHARPVVASRVGGIVDVIKDSKTGVLVEEKNSQALANAIVDLVENPDRALALGLCGQDYVTRNFAWPKISEDLEALMLETFSGSVNDTTQRELSIEHAAANHQVKVSA